MLKYDPHCTLDYSIKTVNLEVEDMILTKTFEVKTPYNLHYLAIAELFSCERITKESMS